MMVRAGSFSDRPSVLCTGPIEAPLTDVLSQFGEVVIAPSDDEATLTEMVTNAVAIVARGNSRITKGVIAAAPRLRIIGRTGIGFDSIDISAATARGIPVAITPDATTHAVAEGVMAVLLALAKRLSELTEAVRAGDWAVRLKIDLLDLEGATLGIIGLGRIGKRVATLASAFGMKITGYDPFVDRADLPADLHVTDLTSVLRESDFITLHCPLTAETSRLMSASRIGLCKRGVVLVNLGRGQLVDLDALHSALLSGQVAAAGLDVFDPEPVPSGHPLLRHPRVVLSPHALALTLGARRRIFSDLAETMEAVLIGRVLDDKHRRSMVDQSVAQAG